MRQALGQLCQSRRVTALMAGSGMLVTSIMAASLALAWSTKSACVGLSGAHLPTTCYSDVQRLWQLRGLGNHVFPYVHGTYRIEGGQIILQHGEIEYPALTGIFAWVAGQLAHTSGGFLVANALLLAPLGLLSAWLLSLVAGRRALFFAASPAVAFYGFLNWDLLAVAFACAGIYFWWRRRPYFAAAAFALGGCAKLWPLMMLLPLVMELYFSRARRQATGSVLVAAAVCAFVNVPFIFENFRGWDAPFAYQSWRPADVSTNSIWYWLVPHMRVQYVNDLSWTLTLIGCGLIAAFAWRRALAQGSFPFVQTSAALIIWFVLANKCFSPQYALWLLPFFAIVRLPAGLWVSFTVADALLYLCWFGPLGGGAIMAGAVFWRFGTLMIAGTIALVSADSAVTPPRSRWRPDWDPLIVLEAGMSQDSFSESDVPAFD